MHERTALGNLWTHAETQMAGGLDPTRVSPRALRVIVFSKDRPLQLDATLRSFELNLATDEAADVHVVYRASTPRYAAGYRVLALQHAGVELHAEADFKADLLGLLAGTSHVLFLVDDTIFVAGFSIANPIDVLDRDRNLLGFSYRLGRNTTYCYTRDKPQPLPEFQELGSSVLTFEWSNAEHDFGYPLELSSSMYRTEDVLPLLRVLEYENPNTLEAGMWLQSASLLERRPRLACYVESVAFSVPANLVQTAWSNRADSNPALTAGALAEVYDRGERLDVGHYQGLVPNACHQELPFVFKRDPSIPRVSVVIPCYNQADYLPEAVYSVLGQTFADWEIVIVDDGSPDEAAETAARLITELGDRVRLVRQPNSGLPAARNAGVAAARGRYILPLDADDILEPTMLDKTVGLLERDPSIAIAYTDLQQFGEGSDLIHASEFDASRLPEANHLSYCSLYRAEVWDAVGGYNPNMTWGYEDWDFWVGAAEHGYRARRIPEPLFIYRIRANSMYSTTVLHASELRQRMRLNHPSTYRVSRTLARRLSVSLRDAASRARGRFRRPLGRSGGAIDR